MKDSLKAFFCRDFTKRLFFISCLFLPLAYGCTGARIIRVSDKTEVTLPELTEKMEGVRLVLVGEVHEERWNHEVQLDIIKALKEAGVRFAIGMEMFRAASQPDLDRWVSGDMGEDEFIKVYENNWTLPWKQYSPIFLYARENKIPLIGLNVSRNIIHRVFKGGFKSLTEQEMKELPPGVKCDVDQTYREFIKRAMEEHEMRGSDFTNFCDAQMVWDNVMAVNSIKYLKDNPDSSMVVLAGSGHSWKRGIPEQVNRRWPVPSIVVLPEMAGRLNPSNVTVHDADYLWTDE